jgi:replicative DNA helicase
VRDKALRRRLIETATSLVREGHESPADVAELLDLAEHKILELNDSRGRRLRPHQVAALERDGAHRGAAHGGWQPHRRAVGLHATSTR